MNYHVRETYRYLGQSRDIRDLKDMLDTIISLEIHMEPEDKELLDFLRKYEYKGINQIQVP